MKYHTTLTDHIEFRTSHFFKGTLFESAHMLVGIDCLVPGQAQPPHMHAGHDKMYYVQQGQGVFTVSDQIFVVKPGDVIWAPADTMHHVANQGSEPLIMLITMAPEPR